MEVNGGKYSLKLIMLMRDRALLPVSELKPLPTPNVQFVRLKPKLTSSTISKVLLPLWSDHSPNQNPISANVQTDIYYRGNKSIPERKKTVYPRIASQNTFSPLAHTLTFDSLALTPLHTL